MNRKKQLNNSLIAISIFLFFVNCLHASNGKISLEAKVDRNSIRIGDLIKYSIVVTHEEKIEIEMPDMGANLGAFQIQDYEDAEPEKIEGEIIQRREYHISTYDIGDYEIPPVTVHYSLVGDTLWNELTTEGIKITVESLKPSEEGDIRDIKTPLEIMKDWWLIIRFVIAGVLILIIGILIYIFIKRFRDGKSLIPHRGKPKLLAHVVALDELKKLLAEKLLEKSEIKQYYIRISEIIRHYIEDRFFIIALEMTTFQLINIMRKDQIEEETIDLVEDFLMSCDMVKFAKYIPTDDENTKTTELAYKIIEDTKIIVEPELETKEEQLQESETEAEIDSTEETTGAESTEEKEAD